MIDLFEFVSLCGATSISGIAIYYCNKKMTQNSRIAKKIEDSSFSVDELFQKIHNTDNAVFKFFDNHSNAQMALSNNKDPKDRLKEVEKLRERSKMRFLDEISIEKNYETKRTSSYKIAAKGSLFNDHPFALNTKDDSTPSEYKNGGILDKNGAKTDENFEEKIKTKIQSFIYVEQNSSNKKGQFEISSSAPLEQFYLRTTQLKKSPKTDQENSKNSSGYQQVIRQGAASFEKSTQITTNLYNRNNKLYVYGISSALLSKIITSKAETVVDTGNSSVRKMLSGAANFLLGRQLSMGVEIKGNIQGVKNGVNVNFIGDLIYDKIEKTFRIDHPQKLYLSQKDFLFNFKLKTWLFRFGTVLGAGAMLWSAYRIYKKWPEYRRAVKNFIFGVKTEWKMTTQIGESTINVSSLTCLVCKSRQRGVILQPCNHLILCRQCFDKMPTPANGKPKRCPQCNRQIFGHEVIFMN